MHAIHQPISKILADEAMLKQCWGYKIYHYLLYGNHVADCTKQHEEMENGMHIMAFMKAIKHSSGNIGNPFANDPQHRT